MAKTNLPKTRRGRIIAAIAMVISLAIIGAAQRDIQGRPAAEIRGAKPLWRLVCLNAVGALAYFRWGRRLEA
jgi:hypothetical protein